MVILALWGEGLEQKGLVLEFSAGWNAHWGNSGRLAKTPGSFQSAASVLGLRASMFAWMEFWSRMEFWSPIALRVLHVAVHGVAKSWTRLGDWTTTTTPHWFSHHQKCSSSHCQSQGLGFLTCSLSPLLPVMSLPSPGSSTKGTGLDQLSSLSLLPNSTWFILYSLGCRSMVLQVVLSKNMSYILSFNSVF